MSKKQLKLAEIEKALSSENPVTFCVGNTTFNLVGRKEMINTRDKLQKIYDKMDKWDKYHDRNDVVKRLKDLNKMLDKPQIYLNRFKKLPLSCF